ncbi:MAG: alpha/beta fold hydrolase, partial [Rhodoferax sp.]|nr:alpha/beta fold hydrolase [Pseudorhodobacter sp.]
MQPAAAAFRVWDKGGARPVLALHCSLAHAGAWSGLVDHLSGVTVTALDQPGHGRAADWDGVTDLHGLTTRLSIEMAEAMGGGIPIDVIGHSFGATVALRMALERPDLVRSLVLIEPPLFAAARAGGSPAFALFKVEHLAV